MIFREVEQEVLDGVFALGRAEMRMKTGKSNACFEKAKEGFVRLLGEDSVKAVQSACFIATQLSTIEERFAEYMRL